MERSLLVLVVIALAASPLLLSCSAEECVGDKECKEQVAHTTQFLEGKAAVSVPLKMTRAPKHHHKAAAKHTVKKKHAKKKSLKRKHAKAKAKVKRQHKARTEKVIKKKKLEAQAAQRRKIHKHITAIHKQTRTTLNAAMRAERAARQELANAVRKARRRRHRHILRLKRLKNHHIHMRAAFSSMARRRFAVDPKTQARARANIRRQRKTIRILKVHLAQLRRKRRQQKRSFERTRYRLRVRERRLRRRRQTIRADALYSETRSLTNRFRVTQNYLNNRLSFLHDLIRSKKVLIRLEHHLADAPRHSKRESSLLAAVQAAKKRLIRLRTRFKKYSIEKTQKHRIIQHEVATKHAIAKFQTHGSLKKALHAKHKHRHHQHRYHHRYHHRHHHRYHHRHHQFRHHQFKHHQLKHHQFRHHQFKHHQFKHHQFRHHQHKYQHKYKKNKRRALHRRYRHRKHHQKRHYPRFIELGQRVTRQRTHSKVTCRLAKKKYLSKVDTQRHNCASFTNAGKRRGCYHKLRHRVKTWAQRTAKSCGKRGSHCRVSRRHLSIKQEAYSRACNSLRHRRTRHRCLSDYHLVLEPLWVALVKHHCHRSRAQRRRTLTVSMVRKICHQASHRVRRQLLHRITRCHRRRNVEKRASCFLKLQSSSVSMFSQAKAQCARATHTEVRHKKLMRKRAIEARFRKKRIRQKRAFRHTVRRRTTNNKTMYLCWDGYRRYWRKAANASRKCAEKKGAHQINCFKSLTQKKRAAFHHARQYCRRTRPARRRSRARRRLLRRKRHLERQAKIKKRAAVQERIAKKHSRISHPKVFHGHSSINAAHRKATYLYRARLERHRCNLMRRQYRQHTKKFMRTCVHRLHQRTRSKMAAIKVCKTKARRAAPGWSRRVKKACAFCHRVHHKYRARISKMAANCAHKNGNAKQTCHKRLHTGRARLHRHVVGACPKGLHKALIRSVLGKSFLEIYGAPQAEADSISWDTVPPTDDEAEELREEKQLEPQANAHRFVQKQKVTSKLTTISSRPSPKPQKTNSASAAMKSPPPDKAVRLAKANSAGHKPSKPLIHIDTPAQEKAKKQNIVRLVTAENNNKKRQSAKLAALAKAHRTCLEVRRASPKSASKCVKWVSFTTALPIPESPPPSEPRCLRYAIKQTNGVIQFVCAHYDHPKDVNATSECTAWRLNGRRFDRRRLCIRRRAKLAHPQEACNQARAEYRKAVADASARCAQSHPKRAVQCMIGAEGTLGPKKAIVRDVCHVHLICAQHRRVHRIRRCVLWRRSDSEKLPIEVKREKARTNLSIKRKSLVNAHRCAREQRVYSIRVDFAVQRCRGLIAEKQYACLQALSHKQDKWFSSVAASCTKRKLPAAATQGKKKRHKHSLTAPGPSPRCLRERRVYDVRVNAALHVCRYLHPSRDRSLPAARKTTDALRRQRWQCYLHLKNRILTQWLPTMRNACTVRGSYRVGRRLLEAHLRARDKNNRARRLSHRKKKRTQSKFRRANCISWRQRGRQNWCVKWLGGYKCLEKATDKKRTCLHLKRQVIVSHFWRCERMRRWYDEHLVRLGHTCTSRPKNEQAQCALAFQRYERAWWDRVTKACARKVAPSRCKHLRVKLHRLDNDRSACNYRRICVEPFDHQIARLKRLAVKYCPRRIGRGIIGVMRVPKSFCANYDTLTLSSAGKTLHHCNMWFEMAHRSTHKRTPPSLKRRCLSRVNRARVVLSKVKHKCSNSKNTHKRTRCFAHYRATRRRLSRSLAWICRNHREALILEKAASAVGARTKKVVAHHKVRTACARARDDYDATVLTFKARCSRIRKNGPQKGCYQRLLLLKKVWKRHANAICRLTKARRRPRRRSRRRSRRRPQRRSRRRPQRRSRRRPQRRSRRRPQRRSRRRPQRRSRRRSQRRSRRRPRKLSRRQRELAEVRSIRKKYAVAELRLSISPASIAPKSVGRRKFRKNFRKDIGHALGVKFADVTIVTIKSTRGNKVVVVFVVKPPSGSSVAQINSALRALVTNRRSVLYRGKVTRALVPRALSTTTSSQLLIKHRIFDKLQAKEEHRAGRAGRIAKNRHLKLAQRRQWAQLQKKLRARRKEQHHKWSMERRNKRYHRKHQQTARRNRKKWYKWLHRARARYVKRWQKKKAARKERHQKKRQQTIRTRLTFEDNWLKRLRKFSTAVTAKSSAAVVQENATKLKADYQRMLNSRKRERAKQAERRQKEWIKRRKQRIQQHKRRKAIRLQNRKRRREQRQKKRAAKKATHHKRVLARRQKRLRKASNKKRQYLIRKWRKLDAKHRKQRLTRERARKAWQRKRKQHRLRWLKRRKQRKLHRKRKARKPNPNSLKARARKEKHETYLARLTSYGILNAASAVSAVQHLAAKLGQRMTKQRQLLKRWEEKAAKRKRKHEQHKKTRALKRKKHHERVIKRREAKKRFRANLRTLKRRLNQKRCRHYHGKHHKRKHGRRGKRGKRGRRGRRSKRGRRGRRSKHGRRGKHHRKVHVSAKCAQRRRAFATHAHTLKHNCHKVQGHRQRRKCFIHVQSVSRQFYRAFRRTCIKRHSRKEVALRRAAQKKCHLERRKLKQQLHQVHQDRKKTHKERHMKHKKARQRKRALRKQARAARAKKRAANRASHQRLRLEKRRRHQEKRAKRKQQRNTKLQRRHDILKKIKDAAARKRLTAAWLNIDTHTFLRKRLLRKQRRHHRRLARRRKLKRRKALKRRKHARRRAAKRKRRALKKEHHRKHHARQRRKQHKRVQKRERRAFRRLQKQWHHVRHRWHYMTQRERQGALDKLKHAHAAEKTRKDHARQALKQRRLRKKRRHLQRLQRRKRRSQTRRQKKKQKKQKKAARRRRRKQKTAKKKARRKQQRQKRVAKHKEQLRRKRAMWKSWIGMKKAQRETAIAQYHAQRALKRKTRTEAKKIRRDAHRKKVTAHRRLLQRHRAARRKAHRAHRARKKVEKKRKRAARQARHRAKRLHSKQRRTRRRILRKRKKDLREKHQKERHRRLVQMQQQHLAKMKRLATRTVNRVHHQKQVTKAAIFVAKKLHRNKPRRARRMRFMSVTRSKPTHTAAAQRARTLCLANKVCRKRYAEARRRKRERQRQRRLATRLRMKRSMANYHRVMKVQRRRLHIQRRQRRQRRRARRQRRRQVARQRRKAHAAAKRRARQLRRQRRRLIRLQRRKDQKAARHKRTLARQQKRLARHKQRAEHRLASRLKRAQQHAKRREERQQRQEHWLAKVQSRVVAWGKLPLANQTMTILRWRVKHEEKRVQKLKKKKLQLDKKRKLREEHRRQRMNRLQARRAHRKQQKKARQERRKQHKLLHQQRRRERRAARLRRKEARRRARAARRASILEKRRLARKHRAEMRRKRAMLRQKRWQQWWKRREQRLHHMLKNMPQAARAKARRKFNQAKKRSILRQQKRHERKHRRAIARKERHKRQMARKREQKKRRHDRKLARKQRKKTLNKLRKQRQHRRAELRKQKRIMHHRKVRARQATKKLLRKARLAKHRAAIAVRNTKRIAKKIERQTKREVMLSQFLALYTQTHNVARVAEAIAAWKVQLGKEEVERVAKAKAKREALSQQVDQKRSARKQELLARISQHQQKLQAKKLKHQQIRKQKAAARKARQNGRTEERQKRHLTYEQARRLRLQLREDERRLRQEQRKAQKSDRKEAARLKRDIRRITRKSKRHQRRLARRSRRQLHKRAYARAKEERAEMNRKCATAHDDFRRRVVSEVKHCEGLQLVSERNKCFIQWHADQSKWMGVVRTNCHAAMALRNWKIFRAHVLKYLDEETAKVRVVEAEQAKKEHLELQRNIDKLKQQRTAALRQLQEARALQMRTHQEAFNAKKLAYEQFAITVRKQQEQRAQRAVIELQQAQKAAANHLKVDQARLQHHQKQLKDKMAKYQVKRQQAQSQITAASTSAYQSLVTALQNAEQRLSTLQQHLQAAIARSPQHKK